jgi:serine/threonine-protein kinase
MGVVSLGEHTLLGRRAAIKTLLPKHSANHEVVERFFTEARATSAISDPGVIQIFDFGYHVDGTAYIVMELLEGESLATRIDRVGKLPLGEALRITRQGASALAAAHARDIVHRDLKPENIFLVKDPEAQDGERTKILDFGICKLGGIEMTQAGTTVGTPAYMSPEQCQGAEDVDGRADVYALGCVLFHMLTGRPPFDCETVDEYLANHASLQPPRPSSLVPGLPPSVDALIARCLAKRRTDRFQSMTLLQVAIGRIAEELDDLAIPMAPTAANGTPQPGAKAYTVVLMRDPTPVERRPALKVKPVTELPGLPPSCLDIEGINRGSPLRTFVRIALVAAALAGIVVAVSMLSSDDDGSASPLTVQVPAAPPAPAAQPHVTASPIETPVEPPPPAEQTPIDTSVTDDHAAAPAPEPKHETARRSIPKAHDKPIKPSKSRPVVDDAFVLPSYPSPPPAPVTPPTPAPTEDLYDTR